MRLVRFLYITRCPHSLQRICSFCPIELEAPQSKNQLGKGCFEIPAQRYEIAAGGRGATAAAPAPIPLEPMPVVGGVYCSRLGGV